MRALLEFKQKLKNFYGMYEGYFQPFLKFAIGMIYFTWINQAMGYMAQINNVFVAVILALICAILPKSFMVLAGFVLMLGHAYALSPIAAGVLLFVIIMAEILLLRFSSGSNTVMIYGPISCAIGLPPILPIGCGILSTPLSCLPASFGVFLFKFTEILKEQQAALSNPDVEYLDQFHILADAVIYRWEMWITMAAVIIVILIVSLVRSFSFNYSWRIAIVLGGAVYAGVFFACNTFISAVTDPMNEGILALIAVLIGLVLEFFVFGGNYSRTERLQFEDDEYYYYVKAVPKAAVSTSERNVKRIGSGNGQQGRGRSREAQGAGKAAAQNPQTMGQGYGVPVVPGSNPDIDFEKKLEESLKDL